MTLTIQEIPAERLPEYAALPSRFLVRSILQVQLLEGGLGGMRLLEVPVQTPYVKSYDSLGDEPTDWPRKFDVRNWGFLLAIAGGRAVGGAAVAYRTTDVFVLEARPDLAVLWDLRVLPAARGAGILLFRSAASWARTRGCTQLKVETQNVNVPACRFYARMGCELGEIHRFGYAALPPVAGEAMLNWYLKL
jgi:GNAT superfamily N-acetyltransferase